MAFGVPIALRLASRWLRRGLQSQTKRADEWEDSEWANRSRVLNRNEQVQKVVSYQPRFIAQTYPAILLIAVFLLVFPLVITPSRGVSLGLAFLFLFLLVGLVHAIRKGDLDWQRTYESTADESTKVEVSPISEEAGDA